MSTVSGGGYLGTFITSVLNSDDPTVGLEVGMQPFTGTGGMESKPIRYLRNHSKYLSEGGLATLALMVFSAAYGIAMSVLLVVPFLLLLAMLAVKPKTRSQRLAEAGFKRRPSAKSLPSDE